MQCARELLLQGTAVAKLGQGIEQGKPTVRQIGANEGSDQSATGQQQDQLPDLQPEQAVADLADRMLPLLAGEERRRRDSIDEADRTEQGGARRTRRAIGGRDPQRRADPGGVTNLEEEAVGAIDDELRKRADRSHLHARLRTDVDPQHHQRLDDRGQAGA
jgi:hypothetical protein